MPVTKYQARMDRYIHPLLTRLRTRKSLALLATFTVVLIFLYSGVIGTDEEDGSWGIGMPSLPWTGDSTSQCSPTDYAAGRWVKAPYYTRQGPLAKADPGLDGDDYAGERNISTKMTSADDAIKFSRFQGCASSREYYWHLASDREEQWDRFPGALEWEWVPGGKCQKGLREWQVEQVIRDLVEGGGWLLVGDSVTENHFFSLSCLLYPHVIATPDYTKSQSFDRAWPQHLYLNPASPLLKDDDTIRITKHQAGQQARRKLELPEGFDIEKTPLVTFRRIDLLMSVPELETLHKDLHPEFYRANSSFKLFSDELVWSISPDEYSDIFLQELPLGNYKTMIVSTAGHWTVTLFGGYNIENPPAGPQYGINGLITFFEEVMQRWAARVQRRIDEANVKRLGRYPPVKGPERQREVVVRAYLPGHEDCHSHREAWPEVRPFKWNWYNWGEIYRYNDIFAKLLAPKTSRTPNIHYLPIDRPARLRPDAHTSGDCLHIMTGAGVLEGWSHYIWHYITREL